MAKIFKNIMEDISLDLIDKVLETRPDVCTCTECINEILACVLSRVPAKYVTTDEQALKTLIDQTKVEKEAEVARAVLAALEEIKKPAGHKKGEDKDEAFKLLLDKIYEDRGLDFRRYHQPILKRRVSLRMIKNNIKTFSDYLMFLIKHPEEYDKLFEVLCINVSEFYRDPDVWERARTLFADIFRQKSANNEKSITVWSAACASGEEPYSIAMMLQEVLRAVPEIFTVTIFATDIDPKALRAAQKGEYHSRVLKNLSHAQLNRYFTKINDENYRINDVVKQMVVFKSLDLIASDFIRNTDVVFCRNVFIYFSRSLQDQLLMKFYKSLKVGGYLILGKTETMWTEATQIFEEVDFKAHMYRKKEVSCGL